MIKCPFSYGRNNSYYGTQWRLGYKFIENAFDCVENGSCALWDEENHCCAVQSILFELRKQNYKLNHRKGVKDDDINSEL